MNLLQELRHFLFGQDVFISYRWNNDSKRLEYSQELANALENRGLDCFVDTKRITAGDDISYSIKRAISKSKLFVLITTNDITKSDWIPLELEQAIKAKCKIVPINVSNAVELLPFDKDPWKALKNLDRVNESKDSHENAIPSEPVSEKIDQSFTFKRNKTRLIQYLLSVSAVIFMAISSLGVYSLNLGTKISKQNNEIVEQTKKLGNLNEEITNRDTVIQGKDTEIANKKGELGKLQTDLMTASQDKVKAEKDRDKAISRQKEEEKKAVEANNKRKTAEAKERIAKKQQTIAENAAELAQIREKEANQKTEEANLIEMGSRASSWSRQNGREISAVELALEASKKIPSTGADFTKAIWNGLTDSVINNGYSKPIISGTTKNVKISPDGELVFIFLFNNNENKYQWNLWDQKTQKTKVFYETADKTTTLSSASFSSDAQWLVTVEDNKIKFWSVDEIRNTQPIQSINCVTNSLPNPVDMAVNKDGWTVAIPINFGRGSSPKIKLIHRNCTEEIIQYDFDALNIDKNATKLLPIRTSGMIFNSDDELLVNNKVVLSFNRNDGTKKIDVVDKGYIYNVTKKTLLCSNSPFGPLSAQTETGDLVFQSAKNGVFKAIVFSPAECRELYLMDSRNPILSVAVNYHRFVILKSLNDDVYISNNFFSHEFAVLPIYNYLLTGVKFLGNDRYLLAEREIFPLVDRAVSTEEEKKILGQQLIRKRTEGWEKLPLPQNISAILQPAKDSSSMMEDLDYFSLTEREIGVWNPKTQNKSKSCQLDKSIPAAMNFTLREILPYALIDNNTKIALLHDGLKISIIDQSCNLVKKILLDPDSRDFADEDILKVSFSDNSIAVVSSKSGDGFFKIRIWDLNNIWSTQEPLIRLSPVVKKDLPRNQFPLAVSPIYRMVLTHDEIKNNYSLFQFSNGQLINLRLKDSEVTKLNFGTFSNNGSFVGVLADGIIKIWDVNSGKNSLIVDVPNINQNVLHPFDFSSDGKSIAVACRDGNIRIYPTSEREYIPIAEKILVK